MVKYFEEDGIKEELEQEEEFFPAEEEPVAEEIIEESKPEPKKKTPKIEKMVVGGSIFVLTNEGLMERFKNRAMRFSNVYENVKFDVTSIGNSGGRLAYDIAFAMVKPGGYLIIRPEWLRKFQIVVNHRLEDGWAYIKK